MFTNEEYANMHLFSVFAVEMVGLQWHFCLLCRISSHKTLEIVHRTLGDNGSSSQVNAECGQQWCAEGLLLLPGVHTNHV
jgi:hypothetical protein